MLPFEIKGICKRVHSPNTSQQQKSEEFYFGQQNVRHIGKRTGRILRPQDHNSSFLQFSESNETQDYLIVAKQQFSSFSEIPRQIEANTTQIQSSKQPDLTTITQNKELKIEQDVKSVNQQQKKLTIEIEAKQTIDRNKDKESRKSVDRCYATVENSPFLVQNVSNVKHRYSGGGRRSEQFLLELLRSEKNSKEINPKSNEILVKNKESLQYKEKQMRKQLNLQMQKRDQDNRKKSNNLQDNKSKELKQKPKSKRVTINDKGKIKFPTDSFSIQFNNVIPKQIRNDFNQIQQKEEQYQNQQYIQKEKQKLQQTRIQQKISLDKQVQKQQVKRSKPRKRNINKGSKGKFLKRSISQEVEKKQQKLTKKRKIEDKAEHQQQNLISELIQPAINQDTGRPIRSKRQPGDFTKNQKTLYNSKNEVIMPGISTQLFLQILGFTVNQALENSTMKNGSNYMQHTFRLKPKQQLCSIGIDQGKLNKYLKPLINFDKMWISPDKPGRKYLQIKIDNFPQQNLDKQIYIKRDQKVLLRNISQDRACIIKIGLERPLNSKQKQQ